jgi:hypothetical protein
MKKRVKGKRIREGARGRENGRGKEKGREGTVRILEGWKNGVARGTARRTWKGG